MMKIPWQKYKKRLESIKDKPLRDLCVWLIEDLEGAVNKFGYADVSLEILTYAPEAVILSFQCLSQDRLKTVLTHVLSCGDIGQRFVEEFQDALYDEDIIPSPVKPSPEQRTKQRQLRKTLMQWLKNNGELL